MIHLEEGKEYDGFLSANDTQIHWIWLYRDKTYRVTVTVSHNCSDADIAFALSNSTEIIQPEENNGSAGSPEKYKFRCKESGKYYIEIMTTRDAFYTIKVEDITFQEKYGDLCLTIFAIFFAICVIYSFYVGEKRSKAKIESQKNEDNYATEKRKISRGWFVTFYESKAGKIIIFLSSLAGLSWILYQVLSFLYHFIMSKF